MLYRINLVLGFALASVFALLVFLRVDNSKPNYQVNLGDDMTYSPAYGSFEPNSNFANGRTMQSPVPGTIARSTQVFHFEPTPKDAIRAGEELFNPVELSSKEGAASADRGAATFKTFCTACHGGDGAGNGPVAKRGFPPPPSLLTGKSRDMKDGQLFHILTFGQSSMPSFAVQLLPSRRWDVINYIRSLQQKVPPPTATTPAAPDPGKGQEPAAEPEPKKNSSPETNNKISQPNSVAPAETKTKP